MNNIGITIMKIEKPIITWKLKDLELLRDDPYNLEDINIEYKLSYDKDSNELRKDIVSFANSSSTGYILFGVRDDPFELVGITRSEVDSLKNAIDHVIHTSIGPRLDPQPVMHPIPLDNNKFVLGIEITPKQRGIYGIRNLNNPNKSGFLTYSFWIRSDGRKRQLSMEEVNNYIIKTDPFKKNIEVSLDLGMIGNPNKEPVDCISVSGVNKSIRPIVLRNYGFLIFNKEENEWYSMWFPLISNQFPFFLNTRQNTKLLDGDSCNGHYPTRILKQDLAKMNINLPTTIKGLVNTNDGRFYSEVKMLHYDSINNFFHFEN